MRYEFSIKIFAFHDPPARGFATRLVRLEFREHTVIKYPRFAIDMCAAEIPVFQKFVAFSTTVTAAGVAPSSTPFDDSRSPAC